MVLKPVILFTYLSVVSSHVLNDKSWLAGKSAIVATYLDNSTCTDLFSCLDCNTARICRPDGSGSFTQIQTIECPASLPYCDYTSGSCSTVPDKKCGQKDDSFVCLADGNYPDINCQFYHVCMGLTATKFECKIPGERYNALNGICQSETPCGTFNCDNSGKKVPHSIFSHYYAYCKNQSLIAVIGKCPGDYKLNMTSQICEPSCEKEGVIQDLQDRTKYYKCHFWWINGVKFMIKDRMNCPSGTFFDPTNYICMSPSHQQKFLNYFNQLLSNQDYQVIVITSNQKS